MLLWSVTHLNAAIFINTVMFLWSSQRQTHFGSLRLDQANHLSSYFCTRPLCQTLAHIPPHTAPVIGSPIAITAVTFALTVN